MKEWLSEKKKIAQKIFHEYGKIIFVLISFLIFVGLTIEIISLITPQKLRVSFLDVGQGDAIFIQTPSGKSMLVDGGPNDMIRTRLASEMSYFDHDIDVMVATHPDADHVTGLIPVLEKYDVHTIVVSPAVGSTQVFDDLNKHIETEHSSTQVGPDVNVAESGDVIDFHDGVTARILYPQSAEGRGTDADLRGKTNENSVSMLLNYGDGSFLLTGDLPTTRENKLIEGGMLPKNITVYKAGHHGSKSSSGEELLTYIRPEYAVISVGKDNKYGHPNPEAIERLQKYSKEIISTIDRGTISFVTDGRMMEVGTSR